MTLFSMLAVLLLALWEWPLWACSSSGLTVDRLKLGGPLASGLCWSSCAFGARFTSCG